MNPFDGLDSTGHVYMMDPARQEMEIDYYARYDAAREMFSPAEDSDHDYEDEFAAYLDGEIAPVDATEPVHPVQAAKVNDEDDIPF